MDSLNRPRRRSTLIALLASACVLALPPAAGAATPSAVGDTTFMTDGHVMAMTRIADTIYIGGNFSHVGPVTGPAVSLSRSSGARDATFPIVWGGQSRVNAVTGDGAGGWWIGGDFTHVGSVARQNLAHISASGAVLGAAPDPDFAVNALALSPDGTTLYAGGDFTTFGGQSRNHVAALDVGTASVKAFDPNTNTPVYALAVAPAGGTVYVGGSFTQVSAVAHNRVAAVDSTTGTPIAAWAAPANVNNNAVLALAADATRVYVGGSFTQVNALGYPGLVALAAADGTLSWVAGATGGAGEVDSLALSGTSLFAGGNYTTMNSVARSQIAKIDATTGATDVSWNPGASGPVYALGISGSTLYMGGVFSTVGGQNHEDFAAVDTGTAAVSSWAPSAPDNAVEALGVGASTVYAGGTFHSMGMVFRDDVAAIDAATGQATSWAPDVDNEVYAMVNDGSRIYIGGAFSSVNGVGHASLAAVTASDGSLVGGWNTVVCCSYVNALALSNGRLFMGGYFGNVNSQPMSEVAAVNAVDGTLVPGWNSSVVTSGVAVDALAVSPDGATLYVGGAFSEMELQTRFYAGAVTTADGSLLPWDPSPDEYVYALLPADGVVYMGGDFLAIGPDARSYAAAVDPVTGTASGWNPGPTGGGGDVMAIAKQGSTIYLGGRFTDVGATPRNRLAAVDAATGALSSWDPSPNDDVLALIASPDGTVAAGGWFTSLATGPPDSFALFSAPPENTAAPVATGAATPGQALGCSSGTWGGSTPQAYSFQWLSDGNAIDGATSSSYTVADGDQGHSLSCRVTATNRAGSAAADSNALAVPAAVVPGTSSTGGPTPRSPLAAPVFFKTADLFRVSGTVLVKVPGSADFVPLTEPEQVQFGAVIDTKKGRVRICTADARGKVECAEFFGGVFKLVQHAGTRPITELILTGGSFRDCPRVRGAATAARKKTGKTVVRHLWGDGKGKFRTRGRYASATIRGTVWLTADRCDGTLLRVKRGSVTVRDFVKRKNVVLKAPRKYLARAPTKRP